MAKRIDEGEIKGAIEPVTLKQTEKILNQMNKSVCKIETDNKSGTGFFCKLNLNKEKIPVLITNFHIIDDNYIKKSNLKITFQLGNEEGCRIIHLTKNKKIFSSNKYDMMVIKIEKYDEPKNINYLEIDDSIFLANSEFKYKNASIYIIHYPFQKEVSVSYGKTIKTENDYDITHKCETNKGSSGSPIFSLSTNKVIGIHKAYEIKNSGCINVGTFLKNPIEEIKNLYLKNNKKISSINHRKSKNGQNEQNLNKNINKPKKNETKMNSNINNFHKNIPKSNLEDNKLNTKERKLNKTQNLNNDNIITKKNEAKISPNLDNFNNKNSKSNLGKISINDEEINKQQNLNIDNNKSKKDKAKKDANPNNLNKNNNKINLETEYSNNNYKKEEQNLFRKNNKKKDVKKKKDSRNISCGEIKSKDYNHMNIKCKLNNFNLNKKILTINNYNENQVGYINDINYITINTDIEDNNKMNIINQKFIRNDYIEKESKNEDVKPKYYINDNKKNLKITRQNYNKMINRYGTPNNLNNIFINYINLNKNDNCKKLYSSKKDLYSRNNRINYKMNASNEKSLESFYNKGKEKLIEKYPPSAKLISTPKLYKKANIRKTKSVFSIKTKELINIKLKEFRKD